MSTAQTDPNGSANAVMQGAPNVDQIAPRSGSTNKVLGTSLTHEPLVGLERPDQPLISSIPLPGLADSLAQHTVWDDLLHIRRVVRPWRHHKTKVDCYYHHESGFVKPPVHMTAEQKTFEDHSFSDRLHGGFRPSQGFSGHNVPLIEDLSSLASLARDILFSELGLNPEMIAEHIETADLSSGYHSEDPRNWQGRKYLKDYFSFS